VQFPITITTVNPDRMVTASLRGAVRILANRWRGPGLPREIDGGLSSVSYARDSLMAVHFPPLTVRLAARRVEVTIRFL